MQPLILPLRGFPENERLKDGTYATLVRCIHPHGAPSRLGVSQGEESDILQGKFSVYIVKILIPYLQNYSGDLCKKRPHQIIFAK